jgi:hypothetical protein
MKAFFIQPAAATAEAEMIRVKNLKCLCCHNASSWIRWALCVSSLSQKSGFRQAPAYGFYHPGKAIAGSLWEPLSNIVRSKDFAPEIPGISDEPRPGRNRDPLPNALRRPDVAVDSAGRIG